MSHCFSATISGRATAQHASSLPPIHTWVPKVAYGLQELAVIINTVLIPSQACGCAQKCRPFHIPHSVLIHSSWSISCWSAKCLRYPLTDKKNTCMCLVIIVPFSSRRCSRSCPCTDWFVFISRKSCPSYVGQILGHNFHLASGELWTIFPAKTYCVIIFSIISFMWNVYKVQLS